MKDLPDFGIVLETMRRQKPLIQCITNFVAMNTAANVVLAAGASPAMLHAQEEAGEFAKLCGAVTINIGTLSPLWVQGMIAAVTSANAHNIPWVFDPVAHFASTFRREAAQTLLALKPTIIRGNASEILTLAGFSARGKGADSGDDAGSAHHAAQQLAQQHQCIVAVTGAYDLVTDGHRTLRIDGGSPLMPQVTALGCALTCLTGAFVASRKVSALEATAAALAMYAVAGEQAALQAQGPASFQIHFIDALYALTPAQFQSQAKVQFYETV
ncbi:hydroxyethylthiazole kinase [Pseudochrobactrum asaccharolyticum]|uniref:Hydroxyethylthiazole kinase n=1 Tax=Pseudochrobactrum asaccharolyticum TaxID=354351 RepID=A0A366DM21_9HYPH|nr:hydroxyethylthiazole kinase [Pseudochrobactrum asaccharolyticum]MBX8799673.1 hydroxyethylthiazole kinase [Ochrobactrum sp. MR28]MBX8815577.1 hydroxyethylthiazole kinase [Ochrobactrum sp. MR31]RBO91096.1 hydroxyethylthiazole kinase [Pseudochrobactrum asaccharolyticum]